MWGKTAGTAILVSFAIAPLMIPFVGANELIFQHLFGMSHFPLWSKIVCGTLIAPIVILTGLRVVQTAPKRRIAWFVIFAFFALLLSWVFSAAWLR